MAVTVINPYLPYVAPEPSPAYPWPPFKAALDPEPGTKTVRLCPRCNGDKSIVAHDQGSEEIQTCHVCYGKGVVWSP